MSKSRHLLKKRKALMTPSKIEAGAVPKPSIQSVVSDFLIIALLYFAAIAWGAQRPWSLCLFSAGAIIMWSWRLLLESARGCVRLYFSSTYIPAFGLLALTAWQRWNPQTALIAPVGSLPYTIEPHTSELHLILAFGYAALGLSVIHGFSTRKQLVRFIVFLTGLGVLESIYGIVQHLTDFATVWDLPILSGSAHGTLTNRNHYALLLNLSICLGVGFLYKKSVDFFRGQRLSIRLLPHMPDSAQLAWIIIWLALIGLGVLLSLSRTGIFALFACVTVMMIATRSTQRSCLAPILVLAIACAIVGLGVYTGMDGVLARYASLLDPGYLEQDRIPIWRDTWKMICAHPWFGQGAGSFQWAFPAYETLEPDRPAVFAHNDYLQVLAEYGVVGLGLVVWLLISCWRSAMRNLKAQDPLVRGIGLAALGALTAAAIQEITDYALFTPGIAAMLVGIAALNERPSRNQQPTETTEADACRG
jgi:O-antigen ligase